MNNIPDFLAHLPIWSNKPMDGVRGVPVRYGKQKCKKSTRVREHQYDAYDHKTSNMVTKTCPVCGKTYQVAYRLRNISKTCSRACGSTLKNKDSLGWRDKAREMRAQGCTYEVISAATGKAVSTVWKLFKRGGIEE